MVCSIFPYFDKASKNDIDVIFLEPKIYKVLMGVEGDKAHVLDGFPLKFAQSLWYLFKDELAGMFQSFHESSEFDYRFL